MERSRNAMVHSTQTSNLADLLERILDKGIVIAGDIKIKLVEVELLTIQVRLMIASVDKAREMGMDWWLRNPDFTSPRLSSPMHLSSQTSCSADAPASPPAMSPREELAQLRRRVAELEGSVERGG